MLVADDADAVIGEGRVHAGDFDFGHVAAGAVACSDEARGAGDGSAIFSPCFVTWHDRHFES